MLKMSNSFNDFKIPKNLIFQFSTKKKFFAYFKKDYFKFKKFAFIKIIIYGTGQAICLKAPLVSNFKSRIPVFIALYWKL